MKASVERVIATLLVLICVVKVTFRDIQLPRILKTPENEVTYKITKDSLRFEISSSISSELSGICLLDGAYLPVIKWLEKQEQDLPPLYSSLELGRNKREFVSNLTKIFFEN